MDLLEKEERTLETEAKIRAPLDWESPVGCRILDLKESLYDEALQLIKRHYFREDAMCKAVSLSEDCLSVHEYLELVKVWLQDTTSVVALSTATERVVGVAVARISSDSEKIDTYNRVQTIEGNAPIKIMSLLNAVILKSHAYEQFGGESYFRIYILCVHPSYQEKGLQPALLKVCIEVAKSLKMPAVGSIFTSGPNQVMANSVGFALMTEICYNKWIVNDQIVFADPGRGNYSAAFMGLMIPVEEEVEKSEETS